MVAATKTIVDGWILFQVVTVLEALDSFVEIPQLQLRDTHVEVRQSIMPFYLDGFREVIDGIVVVSHVLID